MSVRTVIQINTDRCNGCGICADACHEGAIAIVGGRAKLVREDYCDGLGDCLPACPMNAISFVEREAADYDEAAVAAAKAAKEEAAAAAKAATAEAGDVPNEIASWPIQIKLVPASAPYFNGCDLLVAADCTAFANGNFHRDCMKGRVTIIGCPKLDAGDYSMKLGQIFAQNDIRSITIARMTVPCCGGLEYAVKQAVAACGKVIPVAIKVFDLDGTPVE